MQQVYTRFKYHICILRTNNDTHIITIQESQPMWRRSNVRHVDKQINEETTYVHGAVTRNKIKSTNLLRDTTGQDML